MRKAWLIGALLLASLLTGCPEAARPFGSCVSDTCDGGGPPDGARDGAATPEAGGGAETEGAGAD